MPLIKSTARNPSSSAVHKHNGTQAFFAAQAKLEVGKPGDKYEREADNVAEQVVQGQAKSEALTPTPFFNRDNPFFPPSQSVQKKEDQVGEQTEVQEKPLAESISSLVQCSTTEAPPEENTDAKTPAQTGCKDCDQQLQNYLQAKFFSDPPVQLKCEKCAEASENVQAKEVQGAPSASSDVESSINASRGKGTHMDDQTQSSMENGFGADFSGVRIHTGSEAVQMNKQLGAQAFTSGNDIYFNEGKYKPDSKEGQTLLAHELTHTIQQGASSKNVQKAPDANTPDELSKNGEANAPNPNAPTNDPFFEPSERKPDQSPGEFTKESQQVIKNQMSAETGQAESEVPVQAEIREGEPTQLKPENPINPEDQKIELEQEGGESQEDANAAVENALPDAPPENPDQNAIPAAGSGEQGGDGGGSAPKPEITPPEQQALPEIGPDSNAETIREMGQKEPSAKDLKEHEADTRSDEEKQAEQAQIAAQFADAHASARANIEQKIETDTATIREREVSLSDIIRQRTLTTEAEIIATIAAKKAELQAGYAQTRQLLAAGKEADFARLEATKQAKIATLSAEMESRRVSFNAFVDEQTNMPTQNANNEADRADSELEAAAVEALAEGESVARQHPKSDDGHPEARDSVRQIARETAADLRKSKGTIREDLLNAASEFNGSFETYRTEILGQIDSTEQQLLTGINDTVESFKEVINSAYESVTSSLETKETTELQQLDDMQARQLEANRSNEETALDTVKTSADTAVDEVQRVGALILEMLDTLGSNTSELLTPGDEIPLLSAMREMQQSCMAQLQSIEQDGITQLEGITSQAMEAFEQADTGNVEANTSFTSTTTQQASQLIANSASQRESAMGELRSTLDTSLAGLETSLDSARTEALTELDRAIEERKSNILQANEGFLTELRKQNDEHLETAKQPLTDPLIGRLWSAADRATASWWEGLLAAIGDFLLMLIIIVAVAALLVALGVFSTLAGALMVIGGVLLAVMFIAALVSRISEGNGFWSLPLAISDTLGITMIYQGITNTDIATGKDLNMSPFDQWYSGTTGVLQFITIILPFKSRIPGLRSIKFPRIFGEPNGRGPAGWINRGIKWIEGVGRNTRTRGGVERPSIAESVWGWVKSKWPFGRRPTEPPVKEPTTEPVEEPTGRNRDSKEAYARELAAQRARAQAKLAEVETKAREADRVISQRERAGDAQGEFGEILGKSREELTNLQNEIARIRQEIADATSQNRMTKLEEQLAGLERQLETLLTRVAGSHGMRRETADALRRLEELKNDPVGDVNSEPNKNHYNAARIEARNEPLLKDGKPVTRPDGSPYSHIRDLQNAHDGLVNVKRQIELELNNPSPDISNRGIEILFDKLSETEALINRLSGFLNEIGWPPSRPHRWVQRDGVWVGEGDVSVIKPRTQTRIETESTRVDNTRRSIVRARTRELINDLMGRRNRLMQDLTDLQTRLENATTEAQVRDIEAQLNTIREQISTLELDIFNAQ